MGQVDRLGDGIVDVLLEGGLRPDVAFGRDVVGRDEIVGDGLSPGSSPSIPRRAGWRSLISESMMWEVNSKAKTGSMLEEQPAIREIVPVGAMVKTVAFRIFLPL